MDGCLGKRIESGIEENIITWKGLATWQKSNSLKSSKDDSKKKVFIVLAKSRKFPPLQDIFQRFPFFFCVFFLPRE